MKAENEVHKMKTENEVYKLKTEIMKTLKK